MKSSCCPAPLWLNGWKHHRGYLCSEILLVTRGGIESFRLFCHNLKIMGASTSDFYTGLLGTDKIAEEVVNQLTNMGLMEHPFYSEWISLAEKHYRELILSDGSRWTLLCSEEKDFFVHIHPSRHSLHSIRIKASILKSAAILVAFGYLSPEHKKIPNILNLLRAEYLQLSPLAESQMAGIFKLAANLKNYCNKLYRLR